MAGRLSGRGCGPVVADDLEMGALARFGSIPERAAAALGAGCDQVLVCNALHVRAAVASHVASAAGRDPALSAALRAGAARVAGFGRGELPDVAWERVLRLADRSRALAGGRP